MTGKMVKGTMLIDQVRMIRANKQLDWSRFLTPEDWEFIKQTFLPSSWYPLEWYETCGWATFNVLARGDVELVRLRGRVRGKELFQTVYRNLADGKDPMSALERFVSLYSLLFNFSSLEFRRVADKNAQIVHHYNSNRPTGKPYCYQLAGHIDSLIEMTGAKNGKVVFITKRWEGDPVTTFDITWE